MSQNMVHSLLWKAALLATESTHFARMVEAAAWHHGKTYNEAMLRKVAADTEIVTALELPANEGIDAVLAGFVSHPETAGAMDGLILSAVADYVPPVVSPDQGGDSGAN